MKYQIIFSSELEVNVDEFAREWNEDKDCCELAIAETEIHSGTKQFDLSPDDIMMILSTFGEIVAGGVIYDVVKEPIKKLIKKIRNLCKSGYCTVKRTGQN